MDKRILALSTIGMAFWWPLMRNSVTGFVFAGWNHALGGLGLLLACALVLGAALAALAHKTVGRTNGTNPGAFLRLLVVAPCLLASASNTAVALLPAEIGDGFRWVSAVAIGVSLVTLSLAWSHLLRRMDTRDSLWAVFLSYAASFVVGYLSYLPEPASFVRPLLGPALSGIAWLACLQRPVCPPDGRFSRPAILWPAAFQGRLYVLALVCFLVASISTGFINTGSISYLPSGETLLRDTLALCLTLLLLTMVQNSHKPGREGFFALAVLALVLFAGIFVATLLGSEMLVVGTGLMQASKALFSPVMLLFVLEMSDGPGFKWAGRFLPLFVLPALASIAISYFVVPVFVSTYGLTYDGFWGTMSLTMGFTLCVVLFASFSSLTVRALENGIPNGQGNDGDSDDSASAERGTESLDELAQHAGLTPRETDVMRLLVEGNTVKKIAEVLVLSENTVQYHSKNIYRKLGVHTKQELIDLIR